MVWQYEIAIGCYMNHAVLPGICWTAMQSPARPGIRFHASVTHTAFCACERCGHAMVMVVCNQLYPSLSLHTCDAINALNTMHIAAGDKRQVCVAERLRSEEQKVESW